MNRTALGMRASWPHVRAAVVSLHCAAIAIVAAPAPPSTSHVLQVGEPGFASEVHPWARLFRMSDEAFAVDAERARVRWVETRARWVAPFERYLDLVGAREPWSMFSSPNRTPSRFLLEVRGARNDDWLFLSGVPAGQWRRSFFESERVRSFINTAGRRRDTTTADALCERLARDALRERPNSVEVRCSFVSVPSPSWRSAGVAASRVDWSRVVGREP
jgi:hypothetical protein